MISDNTVDTPLSVKLDVLSDVTMGTLSFCTEISEKPLWSYFKEDSGRGRAKKTLLKVGGGWGRQVSLKCWYIHVYQTLHSCYRAS